MSDDRARVAELCAEIDRTPWGPQERALVDEAVRLVRTLDDEDLEYRVRMRLTASANMGGDTETMLSSFAWCLSRYDRDPQRFPADIDNGAADLLWQYKWMASALTSSPVFPQEQIDAVLADMEEHYRRAGLGMSGVLMSQFEAAWEQGRLERAEELRHQVLATPRDGHSHCEACGPSQHAAFLAETGRESEALETTDEMLSSGASCGEEPEHAIARSLLPLLRAGRFEDARTGHMSAYRISRSKPGQLVMIAHHLTFCAVTGNEARGLAMVERHLGWLTHDGLNVAAQVRTMQAVAVVLDAVTAAGYGDTPVRGSDAADLVPFFGEHDGVWSASELAAAAWEWAEEVGRQFDERNGNSYFAEQQQRARALVSERYDVPIETETFAPAPVAEADPTDGPGWLARAHDRLWLEDAEGAVAAVVAALDAGDLATEQRAAALAVLVGALMRQDEGAEAAAVLRERGATLRSLGRHVEADLEQRLGLIMFTENADEAVPALERALSEATDPLTTALLQLALSTHLEATDEDAAAHLADDARRAFAGSPYTRELRTSLSVLARIERRGEEVLALTDEVLALDPDRAERAFVLWHRAATFGGLMRFADGGPVADEASRIFAALGARPQAAQAAYLASHLYDDGDQVEESIQRLRFSIAQNELADEDTTVLRFQLGRALVRAERGDEAAEILADVLALETERGVESASRGTTAYWLGLAYQDSGAYGVALQTWADAVGLFEEGGDHLGAARCHRLQAQLLMQFDELDDAAAAGLAALEAVRRSDDEDPDLLLNSLHLLGNLEMQTMGEPGLTRLREARDLAVAGADDHDGWQWQIADITDSEARGLGQLGRYDEAIAHGLYASDLYREAGDETGAAVAEEAVAGVLIARDRLPEAVAILRGAIDKAEHPVLRTRMLLQLAETLDQLGQHEEAASARAEAEQDQ